MFAVSGAVALGCEAAWLRSLTMLFGASLPATGTVLAAFMAGLALGAELGARLADRVARPVRWYAAAEASVGVWAIASPTLFSHVTSAATLGPVARLGAAFALLAVPTVAMGTTLPLLVAATATSRATLARDLSRLYAINLVGAVVGTLVTGFVLLPRLGIAHTLDVLGAAALCVASVAATLGASATPVEVAQGGESGDARAVAVAVVLGAVSFALQVVWNRALGLLLGSSAYTFAMVSAVILLGLGAGGAAGAGEDDARFWSRVARRCFALAMAAYLGMLVIHVAPFFMAAAVRRADRAFAVRWGLVVLVVGWASYEVGALFPMLAARYPSRAVGRATGRALLATTSGNVVGALCAAFVMVPSQGVQWTLTACAGAALATSVLCASFEGLERARAQGIGALAATLVVLAIHPRWDRASLSAGTYRVALYRERTHARGDGCDPGRRFTHRRVLFERDGALGTVVVIGHPGGPRCALYSLRINGKAEGSVFVAAPLSDRVRDVGAMLPVGDLPTEVLAGWLPAMAGPPVDHALLVGWGTGLSSRALLETSPRTVTAVEIEPAVLDAARLFDAAAVQDRRVHHVVDDARTVIRAQPEGSLDLIASHPSNPWVVGASSLFSREYFALARSRLKPGGRMLAWVQLYETDRAAVQTLVATFTEVFPDAHVFRPSERSRDLLLLGIAHSTETTREALLGAIAARLGPREAAALAVAGIHREAELAERYIAGPAALARFGRGRAINTEDNGVLEYGVADQMLRGTADPVEEILRGLR